MRLPRLLAGSVVVYAVMALASVVPRWGDRDATAQGLPPLVATESCDKHVPIPGSNETMWYAEHAFPGYTAVQLAHLRGIATLAHPVLLDYARATVKGFEVRDGYAAVICAIRAPTALYSEVTFVLPR
jgi:hypothetical protein